MHTLYNEIVNSEILTPKQATKFIGIDSDQDALKASRSTGILWGVTAPPFLKCGRKVLYRRSELLKWFEQFPSVTNNAQLGYPNTNEQQH